MREYIFVFLLIVSTNISARDIDFLIPSDVGSGWDTTAKATGKTLVELKLIDSANYTHIVGAGGGRAILSSLKDPDNYQNTLMVQSAPLILRNLSGVFKINFRDLRPIALMINEYQVVAVKQNSPYQSLNDLLNAASKEYGRHPIVGGSAKYSLDYYTAALLFSEAGLNPNTLRYVSSNGGADALKKLYASKTASALVTGYGEIADQVKLGKLRILGISSPVTIDGVSAPTFKQQGYNVVFSNWRGFFASPNTSQNQADEYAELLFRLSQSSQWYEICKYYGWSVFFKRGDAMIKFLENQEAEIKKNLVMINSYEESDI